MGTSSELWSKITTVGHRPDCLHFLITEADTLVSLGWPTMHLHMYLPNHKILIMVLPVLHTAASLPCRIHSLAVLNCECMYHDEDELTALQISVINLCPAKI